MAMHSSMITHGNAQFYDHHGNAQTGCMLHVVETHSLPLMKVECGERLVYGLLLTRLRCRLSESKVETWLWAIFADLEGGGGGIGDKIKKSP